MKEFDIIINFKRIVRVKVSSVTNTASQTLLIKSEIVDQLVNIKLCTEQNSSDTHSQNTFEQVIWKIGKIAIGALTIGKVIIELGPQQIVDCIKNNIYSTI